MSFEIIRYTAEHEAEWNAFVGRSKNATFLLERRYMDYHADRFDDHSLLFYREGSLYALLPADATDDGTLHSHRGLTYGGLIMTTDATAADIVTLFEELNKYLKDEGFKRVVYKAIPWIYHSHPAEEDLYALFKVCHARLIGRDISSTIPLESPLKWSRDRRYSINKAQRNDIVVVDEKSCSDFASVDNLYRAFWLVLNANLEGKYGVRAVHSIDEILLLKQRFPENIRLFAAMKDGELVGGTLLYITPTTAHAQYISASAEGKRSRAIDAIYNHILNEGVLNGIPFFDFGKSTEEYGTLLNASLIHQKEGFGGRGICYDTYEWDV